MNLGFLGNPDRLTLNLPVPWSQFHGLFKSPPNPHDLANPVIICAMSDDGERMEGDATACLFPSNTGGFSDGELLVTLNDEAVPGEADEALGRDLTHSEPIIVDESAEVSFAPLIVTEPLPIALYTLTISDVQPSASINDGFNTGPLLLSQVQAPPSRSQPSISSRHGSLKVPSLPSASASVQGPGATRSSILGSLATTSNSSKKRRRTGGVESGIEAINDQLQLVQAQLALENVQRKTALLGVKRLKMEQRYNERLETLATKERMQERRYKHRERLQELQLEAAQLQSQVASHSNLPGLGVPFGSSIAIPATSSESTSTPSLSDLH